MTKKEYNQWVMDNMTKKELCLINTNIYYHPLHTSYYEAFHNGDYEYCKEYLLKFRHTLDEPRGYTKRENILAERMMQMLGVS